MCNLTSSHICSVNLETINNSISLDLVDAEMASVKIWDVLVWEIDGPTILLAHTSYQWNTSTSVSRKSWSVSWPGLQPLQYEIEAINPYRVAKAFWAGRIMLRGDIAHVTFFLLKTFAFFEPSNSPRNTACKWCLIGQKSAHCPRLDDWPSGRRHPLTIPAPSVLEQKCRTLAQPSRHICHPALFQVHSQIPNNRLLRESYGASQKAQMIVQRENFFNMLKKIPHSKCLWLVSSWKGFRMSQSWDFDKWLWVLCSLAYEESSCLEIAETWTANSGWLGGLRRNGRRWLSS